MLDAPQYVPIPERSRSQDPLGLGSANMALYRDVFPGMNNRVRYIRVYSAICWMVGRLWESLDNEAEPEDIEEAFACGLEKIQLLLVWANKIWGVKSLPGIERIWPLNNETGILRYREMPTRAARTRLDEDEDASAAGATLLDPNEYSPSATNGFQFLTRDDELAEVYHLTPGGERLAEAFAEHLRGTVCKRKGWFEDPFESEIKENELNNYYELLRLDAPTPKEREAFTANYFPTHFTEAPSGVPLRADRFARAQGLTLVLRALQAEEAAAGAPGAYIDVNRIRHTMARGAGSDGIPLELGDVRDVQRKWCSLQVRQYLKLALETLFRACELKIYQAVVKSFQYSESGERTHLSRSIEDIAARVGGLARDNLLKEAPSPHTVGGLLKAIDAARGNSASLYLAGVENPRVDIETTMAELQRDARFTKAKGYEGRAVANAFFAVLWCASEAAHLPEQSLFEHGDMLPLSTLRRLIEAYVDAPVEELVTMLVRDYVVNLHFDVVRTRAEDDVRAGKMPKDRYRILLGDQGLERNMAGNQNLSNPRMLEDTLLHVLYLLAQLGLIKQSEKNKREFQLRGAGRKRAAEVVPPSPFDAVPVPHSGPVFA
ncbi:hypothetical protein PQR33_30510 [Paraburkholderia sediminicola]|uniref:hypothetical protein n=1 Tax=Paraburkholderia sediminicola TaxID=458836 RepID=UPI0038B6D345